MENEEKFSNDPEEQLRIENELLKLKLQAELGAQFNSSSELPPDVEQQFLKQVMAFHEQQQHAEMIKFEDYVGNPELKPSAEMTADEISEAWEDLELLLAEKQLQIVFDEQVTTRMRYDFVINELFPLEIMEPSSGANWVFDYEEFHPNNPKDMNRRTEEFINDFFGNSIPTDAWYLAKPVLSPGGKTFTIEQLNEKLDRFHGLFKTIKSFTYKVDETKVDESSDEDETTKGFVEGTLEYTIETDDHTEQEIKGPFKLYFEKQHGWWEIFSFYMHGFSMD